jgi:predicted nucleotidyltransferase component of viral defense system
MAETRHNIMDWLGRPEELRAALEFTAAETGFVPALIEKDFWCSLVLWRLFADGDCPLVFKGGTLLSKAYVTFNRLSEDLDFTLPTDESTTRGQRSRRAKEIAARVFAATGALSLKSGEWSSFNISTQHQVVLEYASVFGGRGTIKLEVGQREWPLLPIRSVPLSTLLLDPLFNEAAVAPVMVSALDVTEAYAEKVRATLTRRDPAPRDLYDLYHAVESGVLDWRNEGFLKLVARKVADELASDWLAPARIEAFRRGLEPELRPVLRPDAFDAFDFAGALVTMTSVANALKTHLPAD